MQRYFSSYYYCAIVFGWTLLSQQQNDCQAFVTAPTSFRISSTIPCLDAVKTKKNNKKKKATSAGGGFGAAPANQKNKKATASGISGHSGSGSKVLRKAANQYDRIRQDFGKLDPRDDKSDINLLQKCCRDVYVRSPLNSPTTFWFVGKIAREPVDDDNDNPQFFTEAALAQKRLIFDYSKDQLRPQNMGGKYASALELWLAPADSEMDVATNKVGLQKVTGSANDLPDTWDTSTVGYNPEIYIGDEVSKGGLRVERDEEGNPTKEAFDVNQSM